MVETYAVIANTDISKNIIKDSYEINTEPVFESWTDGNFREHRIYIRDRVKGSFDVIFFDEDNGAYQDFLDLLDSATTNRVLTLGLFVVNESKFEVFEVYYSIEQSQHAETIDGRMVNKMTINIEEC
jgi:hypothetical protein